MKIIVVDLEATCWPKQPPPGEQSEIIEIGVCLFDVASATPENKHALIVKPTRSKVSRFCTKLTSLTQARVDRGMTFAIACDALRQNFDARNRAWASWGDYDRRMMQAQCELFGVAYPFGGPHVNLKALFAELEGLKRRVGMAKALKHAGLDLEGRHHRGADDAWNTARLLGYLASKHGEKALAPFKQREPDASE